MVATTVIMGINTRSAMCGADKRMKTSAAATGLSSRNGENALTSWLTQRRNSKLSLIGLHVFTKVWQQASKGCPPSAKTYRRNTVGIPSNVFRKTSLTGMTSNGMMMIGCDVWMYLVEIWTIESDIYPLFVLYSSLDFVNMPTDEELRKDHEESDSDEEEEVETVPKVDIDIDVSKLTPLSPEVISKQVSANRSRFSLPFLRNVLRLL